MNYSDLLRHHTMVFDEIRNRAYLDAMRAVITPESVVLDLGAGVGVLGLLAAKCGARRVYCVEPSHVASHIDVLARANNVADRVVTIRGRIEDVVLPEQVDVLLSVFTGNLLFTEDLLPSLYFARDRYLKPNGAMIPDRARLLIAGAEAHERHAETAGRYRHASLGIDYSAIAASVANAMFLMERGDFAPSPITDTSVVADLDLCTTHVGQTKWNASVAVTRDGVLHGLLGWIEIRLGERWLSAAPDAPDVHWHPALLPVAAPVCVSRGQAVELSFRFIDDSRMFWSVTAKDTTQQQSTVLGSPDAAIDVMLSSPDCRNRIDMEGLWVERALAGMRQGLSNQAIANDLREAWPDHFQDERDALKRVGRLSARYRSHPARKR